MKKIVLLSLSIIAFTGCLPSQVKDRDDALTTDQIEKMLSAVSGGSDSVSAFSKTVYPLVKGKCLSCHVATNQPFFASPDVIAAHDSLINNSKINFDTPANSRMVARLASDRHNCWSDCAANASEMQAAIEKWKALMEVAKPTPVNPTPKPVDPTPVPVAVRMNTIPLAIPVNLPNGGDTNASFVPMVWTLNSNSDSIDPNIIGATITFDIQKFDDFSYRVRNPRIITPNHVVTISDVRIAVNGALRTSDATYSLLAATVPRGAAAVNLSPAAMVFLMDKGPTTDQLMVSFGSIKSDVGCKNVAGYTTLVKPGTATYCASCHGSGSSFNLVSGTDLEICNRVLTKINTTTPSSSALIQRPTTGTGHPGGVIAVPAGTITNWTTWINSEK
jgi:hypothetical protein